MGMSSMTGVAIVRRKAGMKAGHAGTLDPLATGVLVVAIGTATRSIDQFMKTDKKYRTIIDLSAFTSTDDREGDLDPVEVETPPAQVDIETMLTERFSGRFMQQPPRFSARKVKGRRAYQVARSGGDPKLEASEVHVHHIRLLQYTWPNAEIEIHCEKGFYVRSLARELGQALNTGGHCALIRRTAVGPFDLEDAIDPDDLPAPLTADAVMPLQDALDRLSQESG